MSSNHHHPDESPQAPNHSEQNILTFGCRLNSYESELIKKNMQESGLDSNPNVIILNSCAVTNNAERELKQTINKIKNRNPEAVVIVTGCAVQANPQKYDSDSKISFIIGNIEKTKLETFQAIKHSIDNNLPLTLQNMQNTQAPHKHQDELFKKETNQPHFGISTQKSGISNIMSANYIHEELVTDFSGKSRAFLQIQNGCNHRCTFCIIPFGRGNSRSVPVAQIVEGIHKIISNGYNEIVFTGVDITDYGKDLPASPTLGQMIKRVLKACPSLKRLRLSSIDVAEIDTDILDLIANEPRFMPYLHLSLQSGSDIILKRMARRHTSKQIIDFCSQARTLRPDITFGADIIVGFPTETENDFNNSLDIVNNCKISFLHTFSYSPKQGTPAAKMPQIASIIKKQRHKIIDQAGKSQLQQLHNSMLGSTQSVLIETNIARCENFTTITLENSTHNIPQSSIAKVQITTLQNNMLYAKLI